MYELWGGGAPFSDNGDGTLPTGPASLCSSSAPCNTTPRLEPRSTSQQRHSTPLSVLSSPTWRRREVLSALHYSEEWRGTVVGIASRTDKPAWAQACLRTCHARPTRTHLSHAH